MPNFLVIDDRPDVCRAIETVLTSSGYGTRSAYNGEDGLALLRKTAVDVVVIDLFMPDLDGIGTIQIMRKDFPTVPIIAISGHLVATENGWKPDFLKMAVKLGAKAALRKPFSSSQLSNTVADVIQSCKEEAMEMATKPERSFAARGGQIQEAEARPS